MKRLKTQQFAGAYAYPKQIQFLEALQPTKVMIGGRGAAKTDTLGKHLGLLAMHMAKAVIGLLGPSYVALKNNSLPSIKTAWRNMGFVEHTSQQVGHYVCFRKPPDHWAKPYSELGDYENVITFNNGFSVRLFTWSQADNLRGTSVDGWQVDEAALLDKEIFDKIFMPMMRGNLYKFEGNPYHGMVCFYTSMPWAHSGQWILDYQKMSIEDPENYYFTKATSWDNEAVIGRKTLKRWEREMFSTVYKVEVMCEEMGKLPNAFYHQFEESQHTSTQYRLTSTALRPDLPVLLSFDFNTSFICCLIAQYDREANLIHVIGEAYTKTAILNDLIEQIKERLRFPEIETKQLILYGDRGGYNKQIDLVSNYKIFDKLKFAFRESGFENVEVAASLSYANHQLKNDIINECLAQQNVRDKEPRILIERIACPFLTLNLVKTPMNGDYQKDKSSERETLLPQEKATHLTDAFDYLVMPLSNRKGKAKAQANRSRKIIMP